MATQQATLAKRPVLELINASRPKFEGRLPANMTVDRFIYGLVTATQKNPDLLNCDPQSVVLAAYEAAEVGCDLSPSRQMGWIIPYGKQAQFQPSYRFFVQEAYRTGDVKAFYAEIVYAEDKFRRVLAPRKTIEHEPAEEDRGEPIGVYALIEYTNGLFDYEYMTKAQVDTHRKHSKVPNSLMWTTFWSEGWRKTPIRVLFKRVNLSSPAMEKLADHIERDAQADADPVIPGHLEIEKLPEVAPAATAASPVNVEPITYRVGSTQTEIIGLALRKRFSLEEMKPLGLKIEDGGKWRIPAVSTQDFVDLCDHKGIEVIEIMDAKPDSLFQPDDKHTGTGYPD